MSEVVWPQTQRLYFWCWEGLTFNPLSNTEVTVSVGCVAASGPAILNNVNRKMKNYLEILDENLTLSDRQSCLFQQNNDDKHTHIKCGEGMDKPSQNFGSPDKTSVDCAEETSLCEEVSFWCLEFFNWLPSRWITWSASNRRGRQIAVSRLHLRCFCWDAVACSHADDQLVCDEIQPEKVNA